MHPVFLDDVREFASKTAGAARVGGLRCIRVFPKSQHKKAEAIDFDFNIRHGVRAAGQGEDDLKRKINH